MFFMAHTFDYRWGIGPDIFLDLMLRRWAHSRAMFQYGLENSQFFLKYLTSAQLFFTENLPAIDGTKRQNFVRRNFDKVNRKFFMNFFMFSEVYFRSLFSHLPVTFGQTRDSSSLIFSANLEPSCAPLRCLEAEKRTFYTPPVYPLKKKSDCGFGAYRRTSLCCDPNHAETA